MLWFPTAVKQIQVFINNQFTIAPGCAVHFPAALEPSREAQHNRSAVLEASLTVEDFFSRIISDYFFGSGDEKKKSVFEAILLNSDSCTFATKRRLVRHIINELGLLTGSEKEEFDRLMKRVVAIRNAFAHGTILSDGQTVWLLYFEGSPKKDTFTDDYLTDIETCLLSAAE